jgi:hypothetical protein
MTPVEADLIAAPTKANVDWRKTPPFITAESGSGKYQVVIRVGSIHQLHAAHDLVNKAYSDWLADQLAKDWLDANQG